MDGFHRHPKRIATSGNERRSTLLTDIAYAMSQNGAAQQTPQGAFAGFMPIILIFIIFYFLLIRPQQKKTKAHQEMVNNLKPGDQVITNGGMHGRLTKVEEATVMVEVADRVRVKMSRQSISALKSEETAPAPDKNKPDKKEKNKK